MSEETSEPTAAPKKGPVLPPAGPFAPWRRWIGMPLAKLICKAFFFTLGRLRVEGKARVPKEGGLLVFPNHRSDCDPPCVHAASPRPLHFMAKSELFEMRLTAWATWLMGAFPVRRGEPDRAALRHAAELAKMGEAVCIFPEGQLSATGELQEIKPGVALIVRMAGVPCVCLGLRNTDGVVPYGSLRPQFSKKRVEAVWGEPRTFEKGASAEEVAAWIDSELRRLTGESAALPHPAITEGQTVEPPK